MDISILPQYPINPDDASLHLRDDHAAAVLDATTAERVRRAIEEVFDVTENERATHLKRDDCIVVCRRRGPYGDFGCLGHAAALYARSRNKPEPVGGCRRWRDVANCYGSTINVL